MIARCLAGTLLGLPLSAALIGLLYALPGGQRALIALLLLFFPLWIACMTAAYFFRNGRQAWLSLGTANILAFAALWLAHRFAGA
ncbi:MAG TPA: hypothetical protein VIM98_19180 [Dyella sp.]|uniref:hypothetical protein n=1 Tax=Dyella sp. TaxID=1869338 RepID=UPI002F93241C